VAGAARAAAEALARALAAFTQACLRADRRSTHEGLGLPVEEALRQEFAGGVEVLAEAAEGARRFASGEGRHGAFAEPPDS
jgi:enoyl-CoA hydratase